MIKNLMIAVVALTVLGCSYSYAGDFQGPYVGVSAGVDKIDSGGLSDSNLTYGAFAGYDLNAGSFVLTPEIGISGVAGSISTGEYGIATNYVITGEVSAGFPMGQIMPFATLGVQTASYDTNDGFSINENINRENLYYGGGLRISFADTLGFQLKATKVEGVGNWRGKAGLSLHF